MSYDDIAPLVELWQGRKTVRCAGLGCSQSRDHLKAIHLLAKYGGKWRPVDNRQINAARRSLLKMTPDYMIEFVWIMAKFQASLKSDIEAAREKIAAWMQEKHADQAEVTELASMTMESPLCVRRP